MQPLISLTSLTFSDGTPLEELLELSVAEGVAVDIYDQSTVEGPSTAAFYNGMSKRPRPLRRTAVATS